MPFMKGDIAIFDEILSEMDPADLPEGFADQRPSGEFEYQSAEASFEPKKLGLMAATALEAVKSLGATHFRVHYDGGYDEGFSHADHFKFADGKGRKTDDVAKELAKTEFLPTIRRIIDKNNRYSYYKDAKDEQAVRGAFDELAHALASLLLGEGYGTGEYELYGAFTADLNAGKIIDDPKASKPKKG